MENFKCLYTRPYLILWRRQWHPTPVLLPGKSQGRSSLVGCSPWRPWGSDTTKQLHFHFSLSCIGEGNGNPLQCSCLENPMDRIAWWAAAYVVAQSQTQLKQLSSSSSPYVSFNIYNKSLMDAVENQKDYSYNSSNKLPPNYNPLMLPFKTDFLSIYYWSLLTHFPY